MSVRNYRSTLHNIAADRRSALEFAVFCPTAKTSFLGLFKREIHGQWDSMAIFNAVGRGKTDLLPSN
jgi:hypothetical protein